MSVLAHGPPSLQIGSDGRAHINWHRQELLTSILAAQSQVTAVPVAVFELQRDDLVSAKPQTREKQQHRAIAQTDRRIEITAVDRTLHMLRRYRLGHCRRGGPGGHGRHRSSKRGGHFAAILRVAQKRAHGCRDALECRRLEAFGSKLHERDHVARAQCAQIDHTAAEALVEKSSGDRSVTFDCCGRQPLLSLKMLLIAGRKIVSCRDLGTSRRTCTTIAQELQELCDVVALSTLSCHSIHPHSARCCNTSSDANSFSANAARTTCSFPIVARGSTAVVFSESSTRCHGKLACGHPACAMAPGCTTCDTALRFKYSPAGTCRGRTRRDDCRRCRPISGTYAWPGPIGISATRRS